MKCTMIFLLPEGTIGKVIDMGITDANNMGAANGSGSLGYDDSPTSMIPIVRLRITTL